MTVNVVVQPAADATGAGLDFIEFFTEGFAKPIATPTATSFVLHDTGDGVDLVFTGTGLTYSAGKITGGTITGFDIVSDDIHATIAKVTGLDLDAHELYTAAKNFDDAALDALFTDAYSFNFVGGAGDDSLSSGQFDFLTGHYSGKLGSTISGGAGDDRLQGGSGDDVIEGGAGADQINGGGGNDTLSYAHDTQGITIGLLSSDSGSSSGSGGDAQGDLIIGAFANVIGGSGDDRITVVPFGGTLDHVIEGGAGADILAGGTGNDTVSYEHSAEGVTVSLAQQGVSNDIDFGGGNHAVIPDFNSPGAAQQGGDAEGDLLWAFHNVRGSGVDDVLTGDANDNVIEGGGGADIMTGGGGSDTASYQHSTVGVTIDLGVQDGTTAQASQPGTDADGDILSGFTNIIGSSGNDTLTGDSNGNVIEGGAGADILTGGGGADTVSYAHDTTGVTVDLNVGVGFGGDAQNDFISGFTNILGGSGNDVLTGDANGNLIDGGAGNDTLEGGAGFDLLIGGGGFDTVSYANAAGPVTVDLSAQNAADDGYGDTDLLEGIVSVIGSSYDDDLTGSPAIVISGLSSNNTFNAVLFGGAGDDILRAGGDNNVLHGGAGADTFIGTGFSGTVASFSDADAGVTVNLVTSGSGIAEGDSFVDIPVFEGSAFDDTFVAGPDAVTLDGGASNDTLIGGYGDDTVVGGTGADTLDGGAGVDTLDYSAAQPKFDQNNFGNEKLPGVTVTLGEGDAVTTASGAGTDAAGDKISHFENIIGAAGGDNVLTGNSAANVLTGFSGRDVLKGLGGDDTLIAGTPNNFGDIDRLDGGDGDDLLVTNGGDTVIGGNGTDTVTFGDSGGGVTLTLGQNGTVKGLFVDAGNLSGDVITGVENIIGTADGDTLSGATDARVNVIEGGGSVFDNDRLIGGAGDIASYAHSATSVFVDLNVQDGTTTQAATHDFGAGAVENGDAEGDILSGFNSIIGSGNDDAIIGGAGDDTIEGGAGADTLTGSGGIDTVSYAGSASRVIVDLGIQNGTDPQASTHDFGDGNGPVANGDAAGDVLSGFANLTGSVHDDVLFGDGGANIINGGLGDDIVEGRGGADTLIGGGGNDTLSYAGDTIGVDVTLVAGAKATIVATGGDADGDNATGFANLIGGSGDDHLVGDKNANTIDGGSGGSDTLDGGAGIDTVSYASLSGQSVHLDLGDTPIASGPNQGFISDGIDFIRNFENVIGSDSDDAITGNTGNNVIEGGLDADRLDGGGGIDTVSYEHSASGVFVLLDVQDGTTAQVATHDFIDGNGVVANGDAAGDVLSGFRNIVGSDFRDQLTGDSNANTISGGAGDDDLQGGDGKDVISGGDGDDEIYGGLGADTMDGGAGIDTLAYGFAVTENITVNLVTSKVTTSGTGTLEASGDVIKNFENVDFTDTLGNNIATGTSGNNVLIGGFGGDTLNGGAGDDVLTGNDGNDTLIGGAGNDVLQGGISPTSFSGVDTANYSGSLQGVTIALNDDPAIDGGATFGHGGDAEGDTLYGISTIIGGAGNDALHGDTTGDIVTTLTGGLGDDIIGAGGSGHDVLDGGGTAAKPGSDTLDYSAFGVGASIVLTLGAAGVVTTTSGFHSDQISNFENVIGTAGDDTITGNAGANIINGFGGNDTLDGAAGIDTVSFESEIYGVNLTLGTYDAASKNTDVAIAVVGLVGIDPNPTQDSVANFENVTGSSHDDHITGNDAANVIQGLAGNDMLDGGAGNDTLSGGAGDDMLTGGAGKDFMDGGDGRDGVSYASETAAVTVTLGTGSNNTGFKAAGGGAAGDTLVNIENLTGGAGNDVLTGNENDNSFVGSAGDDTLNGGAGNDTLQGGADNDTLIGGAGNDVLDGFDGTDTVSYAASAARVTVAFDGEGTYLNIFGNVFDVPTGDAVAQHGGDAEGDLLYGIENLIGSAHDDVLSGFSTGSMTSAIDGGAGDDLIIVSKAGGTYFGGAGTDTISFENVHSTDQVTISLGAQGTANAARTTITGGPNDDGGTITQTSEGAHFSATEFENVIGTAGSDSISGDNKNNIIEGGTGSDSLNGNGGFDTVSYADDMNGIIANLDSGHVTHNAVDNDTIFNFEAIVGSELGDEIIGSDTVATTIFAGGGNDLISVGQAGGTVDGGGGNDTIEGSVAKDNLSGGAGDDSVTGSSGADVLDGGTGQETGGDTVGYDYLVTGQNLSLSLGAYNAITGDAGQTTAKVTGPGAETDTVKNFENIVGGAGNDTLTGNSGVNVIQGYEGDDTIEGGGGADRLDGGAGIDTVSYAHSSDGVVIRLLDQGDPANNEPDGDADLAQPGTPESDGSLLWNFENVTGSAFDDNITGDDNANVILGGAGNDIIFGGAGSNRLDGGVGDDTISGGANADLLNGGAGIDIINYSSDTAGITIDLGHQYTVNAAGVFGGASAVAGGGGDADGDRLAGFENAVGGSGDDVITGSSGVNVISGGTGADLIQGGAGADTLYGLGSFSLIDPLAGDDTVSYANSAAGVTVDLNGQGGYTSIGGIFYGSNNDAVAQHGGDAQGDLLYGFTNIIGSAKNDVLTGDGDANSIDAGAGNDTVEGGAGADTLIGGDGIDTVSYAGDTAGVTVNLTYQGADAASSIAQISAGDANGDILVGFENVIGGSGNDIIIWHGSATISGGAGDDQINADAGHLKDVLSGGDGDDVIFGFGGGDKIDGGAGSDFVEYFPAEAVTLTLGVNGTTSGLVAKGVALGDVITNVENVVGSSVDDVLTGNNLTNIIQGGQGDDVIQGGGAADLLDGGAGNDTVSYALSKTAVTIDLNNQGDTAFNTIDGDARLNTFVDGGTDSQQNPGSAQQGGDADGDLLWNFENVTGSAKNDVITGDGGDNVLSGGAGIDTISGGAGDDTIEGGAGADILNGDGDNNTLSYMHSAAAVIVTLNDGAVATVSGGDAAGDQASGFENVIGSAKNDTITGDSGANQLDGYLGNDILIGGAGADFLIGGGGVDTASYVHDTAGVTVDLGSHVIQSGGEAQGDFLSGIANLVGGTGDDSLTGDGNANKIDGGAGDDTIEGNGGNDVLLGGLNNGGGDTLSYAHDTAGVTVNLSLTTAQNTGGEGKDTISGFENVSGGAGADTLTGTTGSNAIDGNDGNDTLIGGKGADALTGGTGDDLFRFNNATEGGDTIIDFNNMTEADKVSIVKSGFGIAAGVSHAATGNANFDAHYFVEGTTATEAGHGQFLFDDTNHQLFWDSDGTGSHAAVLIATLTNGEHLHAADFDLK